MAKRTTKNITLGSGKAYLMEYEGTMPTTAQICVEANLLGYIKGGATLTYTETTYEEKDDLGYVHKIITTEEEAKMKLGLITWNGTTLTKFVDRGKTQCLGDDHRQKYGRSLACLGYRRGYGRRAGIHRAAA